MSKTPKDTACSFCSKPKSEVQLLVSGMDANICESCVEQAQLIVNEELNYRPKDEQKSYKFSMPSDLKPKSIATFLGDYVIGQEDAKKVLAVAVYNHYKRLNQRKTDDVEIEKSNILLVGRTGTGKTLLAKSIARFLNVPFSIVDATVFTEAGYVGEDVESILSRLLQTCDYDVAAAEKGIIYIDEIDKITRKADNPSITRDVSGEGVQQAMLKLLEGAEVLVPPQGGRKHPDQKMVKINTQNILFICGGAFVGIENKIANRMNTSIVGFKKKDDSETIDKENLLQYISPEDLRAFGLIPELIGRLPVTSHLNPLTHDALFRILTEPKNSIVKQYKKLFQYEGIELDIKEDALEFITEKAIEFKLGARGLRAICESIFTDAMYELPSEEDVTEFEVTRSYAEEKFGKSKLSKLAKVA
ncbi:MAG: ATP-dependent Clp protease ATP-binding subunit ClpX [Chitinophagales bacterium]